MTRLFLLALCPSSSLDRVLLCSLINLRFSGPSRVFTKICPRYIEMLRFNCVLNEYRKPWEGILEVLIPFFLSRSLSSLKKMQFTEKMKSCLRGRLVEGLV